MSNQKSPMEKPMFILLIAALGFFLLSFIAMGLAPWTSLRSTNHPPEGFKNPYVEEDGKLNAAGRGRELYVREGCWHCHSQFVRPVGNDPLRYGPPSQNWESIFDVPQMFGTRRIGPDLSRESGRRTDDWHLAHLYNPRSTVPLSVMPGYPWYFETSGDKVQPRQEALDLVAYLQVLGAPFKEQITDLVFPKAITVHAKNIFRDEQSMGHAKQIFEENCIGCHGREGDGQSSANGFLQPKAVNLKERYLTSAAAFEVLFSGVRGTAMPSFHEQTQKDLWALSHYVSDMGSETRETVLKSSGNEDKNKKGKLVYETNCVSCHGAKGTPEGAVAEALIPKPRDFSRRLISHKLLQQTLSEGRPGTAMPPFPQITGDDFENLASYLASLFQENRE